MPKVLLLLRIATPVCNLLCLSLVLFVSYDFPLVVSGIIPDTVGVASIIPFLLLQHGPQSNFHAPAFLCLRAFYGH